MKMIRKLLTTLLVLLSITAVFATFADDLSVITSDNNGTISHGDTISRTLTFTHLNKSTTQSNYTITITSSDVVLNSDSTSSFDLNETANITGKTYNITVPTGTNMTSGEINYTINISDGTTELEKTFSYRIPDNINISSDFLDNTLTTENGSSETFNFTISNLGNIAKTFNIESISNLLLNTNNGINLTAQLGSNTSHVTNFVNKNITISPGDVYEFNLTVQTNSSSDFGIYEGNLIYSIDNINQTAKTFELSVLPESHDTRLELEFDLDDITNDDSDTYPGDYMRISDISITNEYTNNDEDSIEDIELEYNVYLVSDGDDIIEEEYTQSFDLEEDQDVDEFDIQFQVPYDAVAGKYIVEVIVTGEISSDDDTEDGEEISNRVYETFNVDRDSRHVIPTDFELSNTCSENPSLIVDITNIGTNDLDEDDDIYVRVNIADLDISEWHYFNDSIDSEDTEQLEIELDIPANAEDSNYVIELTSKHDGNSNSNKDGSKLTSTFNLECGNDLSDNSDIMITGQTSEDGKSGSQTKYTLSLTNRKDITVKYDLSINEFNWGTAIANPSSITLQPGATTSFDVFVMPGDNAKDTNSLTLDINQNGKTVLSKNLEMKLPKTGIRSLFGGNSERQTESNPILALLIIAMAYIGIREYKMVQKSNKKSSKKRK